MRLTRCFVDLSLAAGETIQLPETTSHHLGKVLRLQAGAPIVLFNGLGGEYQAVLGEKTGKTLRAELQAYDPVDRESALQITLFQALAKGDRIDTAIQKSTELGVHQIVLINADRSTLKINADRLDKKMAHWQGVATSAAEQSGRTHVPAISLAAHLPEVALGALGLMLGPQASPGLWSGDAPSALWLAVGPEGGFTDAEIEHAVHQRWQPTAIGPRVLRTETAGPAVIAAAQALWGDWS